MQSASAGLGAVNALLALTFGGAAGSRATHCRKPWILPWYATKHTLGTGCEGWYTTSLAIAVLYSPKAILLPL